MRLLRAATAALTALLLFAACSDDEPGPDDPMATWTPSGTLEVPSPSATETSAPAPVEPELPDAARKATEDGARAFIEYYWELINYAQVTGDVKTLRAASAKGCAGCTAGIRGIRDLYRGGGHVEGGAYDVTILELDELDGPSSSYLWEGLLRTRNTEQVTVNADGSEHRSAASSTQVAVAVSWTAEAWRTEVMDPR